MKLELIFFLYGVIDDTEGIGYKAVETAHELVVAHFRATEIVDGASYLGVAHFDFGCK